MDEKPEDQLQRMVRQFLQEFKSLLDENGLFITDRQINTKALLDLGLTAKQRVDEIRSISVLDFSAGSKPDIYEKGMYWEFGKEIGGVEVYIKLKIGGTPAREQAICMSFHKAERRMRYPFKD